MQSAAFSTSMELNNILNTLDMQKTTYETKLHNMNWDQIAKVELEVEIISFGKAKQYTLLELAFGNVYTLNKFIAIYLLYFFSESELNKALVATSIPLFLSAVFSGVAFIGSLLVADFVLSRSKSMLLTMNSPL